MPANKPPPSNLSVKKRTSLDTQEVQFERPETDSQNAKPLASGQIGAKNQLPQDEAVKRPDPKRPFDPLDWLHYWDHLDATEENKCQLIEAYWLIMVEFLGVRYGFKLDVPAIHVDKSASIPDLSAAMRAAVVELDETQKEEV